MWIEYDSLDVISSAFKEKFSLCLGKYGNEDLFG